MRARSVRALFWLDTQFAWIYTSVGFLKPTEVYIQIIHSVFLVFYKYLTSQYHLRMLF